MSNYKTNKQKMIEDWWKSPLGQTVFNQERVTLQGHSSDFYGYYQLQTGASQPLFPKLSQPAIQKIMADSADVQGVSESLPFKSHSIDTLLLSHVLEFSTDPHQVLREAERVLVADGCLVLCCFNPWSLWGLRRLLSWQDAMPWQGKFFTQTRKKDWLALLNFEVVTTQNLVFRPPIRSEKWMARLAIMERWGKRLWPFFAGVQIIVARKRTIPLTPIMQRWRPARLFTAGKLATKVATRETLDGQR